MKPTLTHFAIFISLATALHSYADDKNTPTPEAASTSTIAEIEETQISKPTPLLPQGQSRSGDLVREHDPLLQGLKKLSVCTLDYHLGGACVLSDSIQLENPDHPQPVPIPSQTDAPVESDTP